MIKLDNFIPTVQALNTNKRLYIIWVLIGISYYLSLMLPAVNFSTMSADILPGFLVVLLGTIYSPFALAKGYYGILAVYANFFFLFLFATVIARPNNSNFLIVLLAILMLILSGFSFLQSNSVGYTSNGEIVVWCIGAVFWFFSLFALACLIFCQYLKRKTPSPIYFIIMLMIWLIIAFGMRYYQYNYIAENPYQKQAFQRSVVFISEAPFLVKTKKGIKDYLGLNHD